MKTFIVSCLLCSLGGLLSSCAGEAREADVEGADEALRAPRLQPIVDRLVEESGAPGAIVGVSRAGQRALFASGVDELLLGIPLSPERVFRAGSLIKLLTAALVLQLVEQKQLRLDDKLSQWVPSFPNAAAITLEMLLSHTAGVTTRWFDDPELQQSLLLDLTREFAPREVIEMASAWEPVGAPGEVGMHYSNVGYILLGEVIARVLGRPYEEVLEQRLLQPLGLGDTSYALSSVPGLAHGYHELASVPLDVSVLPQASFLSMAGAAGALHTTASDMLRFMHLLFETGRVVTPQTRTRMLTEVAAGSGYGLGVMLLCPCSSDGKAPHPGGFGHGGHVPGYWSLAAYFPDKRLSVVIAINADAARGALLDRSSLDAALARIYETL